MENSTKLLLMASGILITVLIASLGIYNARKLEGATNFYETRIQQLNVRRYNSNFENYSGRDNVTSQEIITLIGIAQKNGNYTRIIVNGIDMTEYQEQQKNDFMNKNTYRYNYVEKDGEKKKTIQNTYSCPEDAITYDSNGYITEIRFEK